MKIKLPKMSSELYEMYPPMSAQHHEQLVKSYATAAVELNRPVVDEAMVARAIVAFEHPGGFAPYPQDVELWNRKMKQAIQAALGEQG